MLLQSCHVSSREDGGGGGGWRRRRHHGNRRNRRLPSDEENLELQRVCGVSSVIISTSNRTIVGLVCGYVHVGIAVHVHADKSRRMRDVIV